MRENGPPQGAFDKLKGAWSFLTNEKKSVKPVPVAEITSETLTPEMIEMMSEVHRLVKDQEPVIVARTQHDGEKEKLPQFGQAEGIDPINQTITVSFLNQEPDGNQTLKIKVVPVATFMSWQTPEYMSQIVGGPPMRASSRRETESNAVVANIQSLKHGLIRFPPRDSHSDFFYESTTGRIVGFEAAALPDKGISRGDLVVSIETGGHGQPGFKIVNINYMGPTSVQAMQILEATMRDYNIDRGFRPKTDPKGGKSQA